MTEPRRALITGVTGQDGSYLAELLLDKGYEVHGLIRREQPVQYRPDRPPVRRSPRRHRPGSSSTTRDLTDSSSLITHLHRIRPDEVYNLGAQSHVKVSFEMPEFTAETVAIGTLRLLEAIRTASWPVRFYQAGSSEMFGKVLARPQDESTPFNPRSPYAVRQGLRAPHHGRLPRGVRAARLQRHPVQPRVAAPGRHVRDPQGDARGRVDHQGRAASCCTSATSMPGATGATQGSTSRRCG